MTIRHLQQVQLPHEVLFIDLRMSEQFLSVWDSSVTVPPHPK